MSGIAAVLYRDGRHATAGGAQRMVDRMSHRGPDGRRAWAEGPVALGHAMLHTTHESLGETLPLVAGPYALTADARIDNRDVLLPQLRTTLRALGLDREVVPDSAVVLAAYARWGVAGVERLVGDFAFALWDARERRLVCARDAFGIRPLYVADVPGRLLAVASEPKALFELDGVDVRLDEARIAESLSGRLYDPVGTAFAGVTRLPGGHVLTATEERVEQRRYWTLEPASPPPTGRYAEQFAELFDEAVRCRLRSAFPISTELSGGLDSSAVTVVAARLLRGTGTPLHTVSLAYGDPASDERPFGQAVLDQLGAAAIPHYVYPEREKIVELYTEIYQTLDDPRVRGNGYGNYLNAREASRHGARVLLTGQDGDTAVGHGWERLSEMALAGDWETLRAEADHVFARCKADQDRSRSQFEFQRPSQLASAYVAPVLQFWAEEKALARFARASRMLHAHFGASALGPARHYWRQLVTPGAVRRARARQLAEATAASRVPPTVDADFARRTNLRGRLAEQVLGQEERMRGRLTSRDAQMDVLQSFAIEGTFNKLDLYGAAVGVEERHPFMDVRLVEFCLALPSSEKLRDGWTRAVLRDAVWDDLPDTVRTRMNKMDHGSQQDDFVFESEPHRVEALLEDMGPAAAYTNPEAVRQLWQDGRRDASGLGEFEGTWLVAALTLALWFQVSPLAPRVATPTVLHPD